MDFASRLWGITTESVGFIPQSLVTFFKRDRSFNKYFVDICFCCRDYEPRLVQIEKKDTLGISIAAGCQGGVFVCSVNEGSVAAKAGLKYGDQLLEVRLSMFNFTRVICWCCWTKSLLCQTFELKFENIEYIFTSKQF